VSLIFSSLLLVSSFDLISAGSSTPSTDCELRSLLVDFIASVQIRALRQYSNWAESAFDALRLGSQCNQTYENINHHTLESTQEFWQKVYPEELKIKNPKSPKADDQCQLEIFVDLHNGRDANNNVGSFNAPVASIQQALDLIRQQRPSSTISACITIREGVYYLGLTRKPDPTSDSYHGAIHLTAADSNLTIRAYQNESVTLSGGVPLTGIKWSKYKNGIVRAPLPSSDEMFSSDWLSFNELYVDNKRAVRAKFPNGDPSIYGLHTNPTGWFDSDVAAGWTGPKTYSPVTNVLVSSPSRKGVVFPNYQMGIGGPANDFSPPASIWAQDNPVAGSQWTVPTGVVLNETFISRVAHWSNPSTGFVHALHGGRWGSWVFAIDGVNSTWLNTTLNFGRGGFQEARGFGSGGPFYIDNILEELDDGLEYFIDSENNMLYFMPNNSMPETFIASQIPCILSIVGTQAAPVVGVTITGLTFSHTSNTYMRDYIGSLSGGDWSVARAATLYIEGTEYFNISSSHFHEIGSNAIFVYSYNNLTSIESNEFSWLGDSAIILMGTTDGIDGFTNTNQPTLTSIVSNHIHEIGIYVKQTAPVGQFLSRSTRIIGNVFYNAPRAGITFNDGFAGGHFVHANTIFNTVRETGDHGPFNSWDRMPYITNMFDGVNPSLMPAMNKIYLNLLFNSYSSIWPLDHDDGSCYYEDSFNVLIYGGYKTYLGHSKIVHDNLYIHPDSPRFDIGPTGTKWGTFCVEDSGPNRGQSGWNETWFNNECHMAKTGIIYELDGCNTTSLYVVNTKNNTFFIPTNTTIDIPCGLPNGNTTHFSLEQWKIYGEDAGSSWSHEEPFINVINKARNMLGLQSTVKKPNKFISSKRRGSSQSY